MPNPTATECIARINRTFDYIEANLAKPFTLQELASVASFSKFHFNRIFCAMVGETPFSCINRVRIERAATLLVSPGFETVTDVAFKVGFKDQSVFSRYFKNHFQLSPTQYRTQKSTIAILVKRIATMVKPIWNQRGAFAPVLKHINGKYHGTKQKYRDQGSPENEPGLHSPMEIPEIIQLNAENTANEQICCAFAVVSCSTNRPSLADHNR